MDIFRTQLFFNMDNYLQVIPLVCVKVVSLKILKLVSKASKKSPLLQKRLLSNDFKEIYSSLY